MYLTVLQNIRKKLLSRFAGERLSPLEQKPLGIGAGGDKTFPVDRIAEEIVIGEFEASGLPCTIISEEYGLKEIRGGGSRVLIDPIDGSKNAISGIPFYCTSIAIAEGDTISSLSLAYVVNLINGDEFVGERGKGAFLNNIKLFTQKHEEFSLIAYEAQTPGRDIALILPLLSRAHKTRCLGATALDLAYLANGSVSIFVTPSPSRSFDFAGGWLLVKEAGGLCTDMQGNSLEGIEIGLKRSVPLLASGNPALHERALRILNG